MEKLLKKLGDAIRADKKEYALDILELISDEHASRTAAPMVRDSNLSVSSGMNRHTAGLAVPLPQYHDDRKIDEAAMLDKSASGLLSEVRKSTIIE